MRHILRTKMGLGVLGMMLLGLDLVSKGLVPAEEIVANYGGVFGTAPGFAWESVWVMLWVMLLWQWWKTCDVVSGVALTFILAGGMGNILDRFMMGYVRDFLYYPMLGVYGNVADIWLTLGVLIVLGKGVYESIRA